MKKLLIVAAVVVVALVVVVGVVWGPGLLGPTTPLGRIAGVEKINSFAPDGAGNLSIGRGLVVTFVGGGSPELQAEAGYQLWLVRFSPMSGKLDDSAPKASLIDDAGEKHTASWLQVSEENGDSRAALVFCLPEGKTPRKIQFGDAAPLDLP